MVEKQPSHSGEAQPGAKSDRPVMVLTRLEPTSSHFEAAKQALEKWTAELKNIGAFQSMDIICCMPEQIAWIEQWKSKLDLDDFNKNHLVYSGFMVTFFENSRTIPTRYVYRKLF